MISKNRIAALTEQAEDEGIEGDIEPVLERAWTVGDLIKALQKFPADIPVELEIPVEILDTTEMTSEAAYLIGAFETPGATKDSTVITLRACKPDLLDAYIAWESEELN